VALSRRGHPPLDGIAAGLIALSVVFTVKSAIRTGRRSGAEGGNQAAIPPGDRNLTRANHRRIVRPAIGATYQQLESTTIIGLQQQRSTFSAGVIVG
jgi:hypothetical protein